MMKVVEFDGEDIVIKIRGKPLVKVSKRHPYFEELDRFIREHPESSVYDMRDFSLNTELIEITVTDGVLTTARVLVP